MMAKVIVLWVQYKAMMVKSYNSLSIRQNKGSKSDSSIIRVIYSLSCFVLFFFSLYNFFQTDVCWSVNNTCFSFALKLTFWVTVIFVSFFTPQSYFNVSSQVKWTGQQNFVLFCFLDMLSQHVFDVLCLGNFSVDLFAFFFHFLCWLVVSYHKLNVFF